MLLSRTSARPAGSRSTCAAWEDFMTTRPVFLRSTLAACVAMATVIGPSTATAKPNKPENAAQTADGKGCLVRDANGAYLYDAECEWHTVIKKDKNGAIQMFNY